MSLPQFHQNQARSLSSAIRWFQELELFSMRPLRRKAILITILAASLLYCIVSLTSFSLFTKTRTIVLTKKAGYEEDIDTLLDMQDRALAASPSSQHDEFAFLKRQHILKESLEDSASKGVLTKDNSGVIRIDYLSSSGSTSDALESATGGIKCRNSIQGKLLIADDRGYVCERAMTGINGCCRTSEDNSSITSTVLYSCETCQSSGCCAIYEHCISCCMAPSNRDFLNRLVGEKKSPVFKIFIASITDYFELCLTKCRTSSTSVQHENTYRNPTAKFCFSNYVAPISDE